MRVICIVLIFIGATYCFAQDIRDPGQLLGKKVVAQRMPLCEPGSFNTVMTYAGKQAVVIAAKPSKSYKISQSVLSRMTPEARAMVEDQQKAATLVVQFEDGKKLDTCAAVSPRRISEYFELADGEKLGATAAQPGSSASNNPAQPVSPAQPAIFASTPGTAERSQPLASPPAVEALTDEEVKSALTGSGKDHYVQINDAGLMAAQGAFGTLPHISLFMPEAIIAVKKDEAKKQFLSYDPSEDDRKRLLTVFAQGYIGKTYQEGCVSVTRVVLLSSPAGEVVEESYSSEAGSEEWANAFGATNHCQWLRATFSLAAVKKVKAAAKDGEFYIAVFAGTHNTKTYKIKHKHQEKLALN